MVKERLERLSPIIKKRMETNIIPIPSTISPYYTADGSVIQLTPQAINSSWFCFWYPAPYLQQILKHADGKSETWCEIQENLFR